MPVHPSEKSYYTELIRIVTGLFVGVLALMTFLLTVGYQRPHAAFAWSLYASIVILALNLVAYVIGHAFRMNCTSQRRAVHEAAEANKDTAKLEAALKAARSRLKIVRLIQQVLFVAAIVAVTCLAVATANFFFAVTPAAAGAATQ